MIDNTMVYIEFNHGDKRVVYTHHDPTLLLLDGASDEIKGNPDLKKQYMEEQQVIWEERGKFIPRSNYEVPPEDGFLYDQIFDDLTNKVTYVKRDVEMPAQTKIKQELSDTNNKITVLEQEKAALNSKINQQTSIITDLTNELANSNKKLADATAENSGVIKDLMNMMANQNAGVVPEPPSAIGTDNKADLNNIFGKTPDNFVKPEGQSDPTPVESKDQLASGMPGGEAWLTPDAFPDGPKADSSASSTTTTTGSEPAPGK